MLSPTARLAFAATLLLTLGGCAGSNPFRPSSRWAMEDPEYANKYGKPYPSNDLQKNRRIVKQMSDARHFEGDAGLHLKAAYSNDPDAGLIEVGAFGYPAAWVEVHGGLSLFLGENDIIGFPGGDLGVRFQTPSRLAPFVGTGIYSDVSQAIFDNDDDDCGCYQSSQYRDHFAAAYPEFGVHYWLDGSTRLTLSAGYYFNSNGRNQDFWMIGFTLAGLNRDRGAPNSARWTEPSATPVERDNLTFMSPPLVPLPERDDSIRLDDFVRKRFGLPSAQDIPSFETPPESESADSKDDSDPPLPGVEPAKE